MAAVGLLEDDFGPFDGHFNLGIVDLDPDRALPCWDEEDDTQQQQAGGRSKYGKTRPPRQQSPSSTPRQDWNRIRIDIQLGEEPLGEFFPSFRV